MAGPDPIENEFVARVDALPAIRNALDHEPERLPAMPCVTLLFVGATDRDDQTGPATEVWWEWEVTVYISLGGKLENYRDAQAGLKTLLPEILRVVRQSPSLGGSAIKAELVDPLDPPEFDHRRRLLSKTLRLRALTEEL